MKITSAIAGLAMLAGTAAIAQDLPDLGGREIVVVTEDDFIF